MKKLGIVVGGLLVVLIVAVVVIYTQLGTIIRAGVETIGPQATGAPISLSDVDISVFSGKAGLNDLILGNPEGFKSDQAFKLGRVRAHVDVGTVTQEVMVIKSILIDGAEITWEGWNGNNHRKIMQNIQSFTGPSGSDKTASGKTESGGSKQKVVIEDFRFQNSAMHFVLAGQSVGTVNLPEIHMTDIGKKSGGQDLKDTLKVLYAGIMGSLSTAVASNRSLLSQKARDLQKVGTKLVKEGQETLSKSKQALETGNVSGAVDSVKKVTKGLGGLLKKE